MLVGFGLEVIKMISMSNADKGEILIYQTENGSTRIEVRLQDETLWLTQMQMAELFQKDKVTISEHISHIFQEAELTKETTVRNFRTVQKEGNREVSRDLSLYSLDVVISVGYRVKSIRGTQFRIKRWSSKANPLIKYSFRRSVAQIEETEVS
jgi:hypothetical protein